ncbi:SinI family restriction endonuclease [Acinetobacter baumannii]|uniref:SinI family restriction endonuclease n=1 Tax=Acinetobacter baumannii TaxID=470 RepID=UPI000451B466|nr:SinI family restriction endonuclease [Acinetobacter baumannii]EXR20838.1 sinI restriction endonuclease family protein [Acinetobacter baumannii 1295549]EXR92705.1 sinI restriction endonuclease family protein [Acinetobacter baumannii 277047]EXS38268.1 sinI restriction endonuclease family protein [Acinetobacter baumannii 426863]MCF7215134.1 SinI family restriction endonuclease [Acinetobacter baumannii]MDC4276903.1 SinI family restriction endonuclease [Acinetobacter baumannii]
MYDPKFQILLNFLEDNPDRLSSRSKKLHLDSTDGINALHDYYLKAKNQKLLLSTPTTIPDEAVSVILQQCRGFSHEQTEKIKIEHQLSMSAENLVGALLERYIATVLEPHGWIWCAGDFIRAIDFIKYNKTKNLWEVVQVKNRDNTENSSSSAIRNGTTIEKWFRTYSKPSKKRTGNTNWENFPEKEFRGQLSEEGFLSFIKTYLKN